MSNIEKIQKMVKGIYNRPIQVGYTGKTLRKEGEEWEDHNGRKWKMQNGQRKQITKVPARGIDKCSDCEKMILKDIDQDTYNRMNRCYHCQINFEVDLKAEGKWEDWVKEMEEKRWETILKEYESEMELYKDSDPFDKSVVNALSDENIKSYK
tara:strand:+ start:57 stop:515 length:459 start_codon:yes stop_codon:yes gene_type:complete